MPNPESGGMAPDPPESPSEGVPLPQGWDIGRDYDGKIYFIDHNTKKTTWVDPRDR